MKTRNYENKRTVSIESGQALNFQNSKTLLL